MSEPSYTLLAVDDNELNLGLFRMFLTQLGHQVTALNNPFDAIDLVPQQAFDMIFTDVQMPGMTGIEAAARIRDIGYEGPIVAITAHLSNIEEDELASSNINGFLIKPVTKQDLIRIIAEQLQGQTPVAGEQLQRTPVVTGQNIYDLELALHRANQSPELAAEMMQLLGESLTETKPLLNSDNVETLDQDLHKLTGGVRYSGASRLEQYLEETRKKLGENVPINLEQLHVELQLVIDWIADNPEAFKS